VAGPRVCLKEQSSLLKRLWSTPSQEGLSGSKEYFNRDLRGILGAGSGKHTRQRWAQAETIQNRNEAEEEALTGRPLPVLEKRDVLLHFLQKLAVLLFSFDWLVLFSHGQSLVLP
jgi:hypothetical protein